MGWNWRIGVRAASSHQRGARGIMNFELGTSDTLAPAGVE
ncbi:hypothetical protein HMPREF9075_00809 [Capnocytophaga sp. oral taxon 332 str. F0381]|nr:hypothetical protein HMPREF9075_00809 [Capnocytophaga sp. oral taxon 332 str. F0381]